MPSLPSPFTFCTSTGEDALLFFPERSFFPFGMWLCAPGMSILGQWWNVPVTFWPETVLVLRSALRCQGTYNLHCGCFLLVFWALPRGWWMNRTRGLPPVFPWFFISLPLDVGCSLGKRTAGFLLLFLPPFLHFIVVPWIATRYRGKLHNLMKPLVSSFFSPEFQRIRGTY